MPFATPSTAAHVPRHLLRWLVVVSVCVLLSGALLTWWTLWRTGEEMRESLLAQARRVTHGLHLRRIRALTGTDADLASPSYQRLKAQLTLIRHAYDQCRFVYLMGCTSNQTAAGATVFFFVDSENPTSEDYSPPGQIYPDATPALRAAFTTGVPFVEGPLTDAWGTWVSALVPITNPRTHAVIALLGMDVDARTWRRTLWRAAWPPLLLTAGLMTMLVLGTSLLDWRRRHAATCAPWLWRLEAGVVVVFGAILTCYATWVAHNEEMHARRRVFMQLAESETDQIIDSICDVREFELGALARFFEASEAVTYDEFQHYAGILEDDPAVFSWQWLPAVPAAEKRQVEAQLRALGAPATSLWQHGAHGAPEPVPDRAVYYPVMYVMPRAGNEWSLGFDAGSEPMRRAAMLEAERAGLGTGTELIRLGMGAGPPQGMVVFYPVRAVGAARRLRGYVAAVVRFDALPQLMLDASIQVELLLLRDGASAAVERTLHTAADVHDPTLVLTRPVPAFGKVLWICAHPGENFMRRHAARAGVATALIGMTLTLALATLVGVPLRRRYELEQLVAARTNDLSISERHYRNLFTSSRDGIVEVDNQRRIVNANEAYCAMLGYTLEELRALPNFDAITPPHWHAWERDEIWQRRLAQQYYSGIYEKEYVRRDGTVFPVEVQAFVVGDHADATYYAWATVRDITERKRVEAERERLLQDAEHARRMLMRALTEEQRAAAENARLAAAMQQATDAVVITDVRGIIQYVNPAFERTSGYTRAEVIGHTPRLLKSGQHPDTFYHQLWATISAGNTWQGQITNCRKSGSLYTDETTITPVHDATGHIVNYVAVCRDITEHLRLADQLRQAQKLESIGRLAGGVAHDFNNMLSVILGRVDMALETVTPSQPSYDDLQEIRGAATRSAELTRQLLTFARKQAIAPKVLDLNQTITGLLRMLRRVIGEQISLVFQPGPQLWPIRMDISQLDQVLTNLCLNARDAITGTGTITIETANVTLNDSCRPTNPACAPGDYVALSVHDDGRGIPAEVQAHLFEPFFTTKELGVGTGLGLPIVYGIVTQNHGAITVTSASGQGTTFCIYLPRQTEAPRDADATAPVTSVKRGAGQTILLVEDEPSVLALNQTMLEKLGYHVLAAAAPAAALDLFRAQRNDIQLLITDVVMPGMSGTDLAAAILALKPGLPCLFMSGYTGIGGVRENLQEQSANFIQKPFALADLAEKIHAALSAAS